MNTASILIKTDPQVKEKVQKTAKELGFSLSSILNAYLRQFVKTKTITFSTAGEEPSGYLLKSLKESQEDIRAGRVSPAFDNVDDAIAWLDDANARYQNGDTEASI